MLVILILCTIVGCKGDAKEGSAAQRSAEAGSTRFNGTAAYNYAKAQVDFGPRVPGTPAAKQDETLVFALASVGERDITTPRPEQTSQGVESSGQGTYELAYDDRIGFRAPLHDHPEA
jgi:hypothetical protein